MNKRITIPIVLALSLILFFSCKTSQQKATEMASNTRQETNQGPPPRGDRQGPPPQGERRGPPPGGERFAGPGGGRPEQTESPDSMKGYKIGEVASDFSLKNIDGKMVSLADLKDAKGYIVTFTCNECPFAIAYEDRLIALHNTYAPMGYPVIAINPNSGENPSEGLEAMQKRAGEKGFTFPYLTDENQKEYPQYGALRTPHVFLLDKQRVVRYIGTIDDNARSAENVKVKYVENAIAALEKGANPSPDFTKAIGCPIKASAR